jgi:hypothetical protein
VLGIGGGGDVVGALALGRMCEALGTEFVLGGVAWERFAIDPHPGPRSVEQIRDAEPLAPAAVLAGPDTATPEGVRFCEAGMAAHLGRPTVLIDVNGGPVAVAESVVGASRALDCDVVIHVDVGGDVLAHGDESGLASPLCDAVMLAAAARVAPEVRSIGAVFGPGCDGELSAGEVLERIGEVAAAGGWLGAWGLTQPVAAELEVAARLIPTEASLQAVRCARGETGEATIRDGRVTVQLGPVGALALFFDVGVAFRETAPLARAVAETDDLEQARASLQTLGVRTELDYQRERAAESPQSPG